MQSITVFMEDNPPSAALETAIISVREEEQKRMLKLFRDKVVPNLLAAMFEAQSVKEELEWRGSQKGDALSRMIESLVGAVCGIDSIADPVPVGDELEITPNTLGRTDRTESSDETRIRKLRSVRLSPRVKRHDLGRHKHAATKSCGRHLSVNRAGRVPGS